MSFPSVRYIGHRLAASYSVSLSTHVGKAGSLRVPYSVQGCGTKYYGKKAEALDGSYVTTEWVTLLHLPLIPLGSYRVLPQHSPHTHFHLSPDEIGINVTQEYLTTSVPLDGKQILNIYLCDLVWIGALFGWIALLDASPNLALIVAGVALSIYVVKEAIGWIAISQSKQVAKLCSENKFAAALPIALRAERMTRGFGESTISYMIPLRNLAFVYIQLDQLDKAEPLFRKSAEIQARSVGKNHAGYVKSSLDLAQLYRRMGQPAKAEPLLSEAVAVTRRFGSANAQFRSSLVDLGLVYEDLKRFDRAAQIWTELLSLTTEDNPDYRHIVKLLGMDYAELQQFDKAQPFFQKTAEFEKLAHGDTSLAYAVSLHNLAFAQSRLDQTEKAQELYRTALKIFGKADPERAAQSEFELKQLDAKPSLPPPSPPGAPRLAEEQRRHLDAEKDQGRPSEQVDAQRQVREEQQSTAVAIRLEVGVQGKGEARLFVPGAGKTEWFKDLDAGPEMVMVPAGSFIMGSPESEAGRWKNEGPQHKVTFATSIAVSRFMVTFDEWDACVADGGGNGYQPGDQHWGRGRRPVINVSFIDATAYCAWLARRSGRAYRLLSEAEWEYVTRAGTMTQYWWGRSFDPTRANHTTSRWGRLSGGKRTFVVDSFDPNPWGLYQVHGNVWGWTLDVWHENYDGAPADGSAWTSGGDPHYRVFRGGSWRNQPGTLRSAVRNRGASDLRDAVVGFRVARLIEP